ncbi:diguanylate cyclase [Xanthobacter sp. V4C-4]|uniref:diguanylate cyclase domain-containing protein n=1 Tax=Xanthobacter cornucopiae TaxID=3119924 RepID=UPI00372BDF8F
MVGQESRPPGAAWDAFCRTACALLDVASVCVRDGAGGAMGAAELAEFCRRTAPSGDGVLAGDPSGDSRLSALLAALVSGSVAGRARFCAVVPLRADGPGAALLGVLIVSDPAPRALSDLQRRQLADLGAIATSHLRLEAVAVSACEQASLYRLLADNSTDTIVRGNLDGVRLYVSPAVHALLGYTPDELVGRRAAEIVHPDDLPAFQALMGQIRGGHIDVGRSEQRQRHKQGGWVWIEAFIRLTYDKATGAPDGYVVSVRDISRRKAAELRLEHLATHDALTGLANRSLLQDRLDTQVRRAARAGTGFAVLCIDLDHFKQVNDTHGHAAGDAVLRAAADRFNLACGRGDLVARLGGDEFIIVMAPGDAPLEAAEGCAAQLIEAMAQPISFQDTAITVGLSIGIAIAAPATVTDELCVESLLRAGDAALYAAKDAGRNRFVVAGAVQPR